MDNIHVQEMVSSCSFGGKNKANNLKHHGFGFSFSQTIPFFQFMYAKYKNTCSFNCAINKLKILLIPEENCYDKIINYCYSSSKLTYTCHLIRISNGSFGCAPGCDAGGREFETPTGPTLRVFK